MLFAQRNQGGFDPVPERLQPMEAGVAGDAGSHSTWLLPRRSFVKRSSIMASASITLNGFEPSQVADRHPAGRPKLIAHAKSTQHPAANRQPRPAAPEPRGTSRAS